MDLHLSFAETIRSAMEPLDARLGPVILHYGSMASSGTPPLVELPDAEATQLVPAGFHHPLVQRILGDCSEADVAEAGLDETAAGVLVPVDADGGPAAACWWHEWPERIAHLGVLTALSKRRRGFGLLAADATTTAAVRSRLLPQWRALESNRGYRR